MGDTPPYWNKIEENKKKMVVLIEIKPNNSIWKLPYSRHISNESKATNHGSIYLIDAGSQHQWHISQQRNRQCWQQCTRRRADVADYYCSLLPGIISWSACSCWPVDLAFAVAWQNDALTTGTSIGWWLHWLVWVGGVANCMSLDLQLLPPQVAQYFKPIAAVHFDSSNVLLRCS